MAHDTEVVNPRAKVTRVLLAVYGVCIYIFLFAPILVMMTLSFNTSKVVGFPMTGVTLNWYAVLSQNAIIQGALANTIWVATWVVILATAIGTAAAFPLVRARIKYPAAVRVLVTLPIMIPGLLIGVAILVLSTNIMHLQPSLPIAVIGQAVLATPFVILVVSSRLETLDGNFERAAADLGAGPVKRFVFVVLPLIYPGIVAAALMAFTLSLDEFVVTNFIIGSDQTLPIYIYSQLKFGITPEVNALATLMLFATIALIGVTALALKLIKMLSGAKLRRAQPEVQNA
jgi:ABC-type spermidine/putrescine transport system permease subunit II